jgi:hypothetical protein
VAVALLHVADEVHFTQFALTGVPLVPKPALHTWIVALPAFQTAPVKSW